MKFLIVLMVIVAVVIVQQCHCESSVMGTCKRSTKLAVAQHAHFCNHHHECHCHHGSMGQCVNNMCDCNQASTAAPMTTGAAATTMAPGGNMTSGGNMTMAPATTSAPVVTAAPISGCPNHCHDYPCQHGHGHCDHALNSCKCGH